MVRGSLLDPLYTPHTISYRFHVIFPQISICREQGLDAAKERLSVDDIRRDLSETTSEKESDRIFSRGVHWRLAQPYQNISRDIDYKLCQERMSFDGLHIFAARSFFSLLIVAHIGEWALFIAGAPFVRDGDAPFIHPLDSLDTFVTASDCTDSISRAENSIVLSAGIYRES